MKIIHDGEPGRLSFMPRHFGRAMMMVERRVFDYAGEALRRLDHSPAYNGGVWDFAEDGGAGWMIPPCPDRVRLGPVGEFGRPVGELSREAAGLALTIMAVNHCWHLLADRPEGDALGEEWGRLMEVAAKHPEREPLLTWLD